MKKIFEYIKQNNSRAMKALATVLAAIVVFTTTYSLILPAITIEHDLAAQEPGLVLAEETQETSNALEGEVTTADPGEEISADAGEEPGASAEFNAPAEQAAEAIEAAQPQEAPDAEEVKTRSNTDISEESSIAGANAPDTEHIDAQAEGASETAGAEEIASSAADTSSITEETKATSPEERASQNTASAFAEVKMPKATFEADTDRANKNKADNTNIHVTVEAEAGTFPEGTTMKVQEVTDDSEVVASVEKAIEDSDEVNGQIQAMQAVDISFYNKDGEEIEPLKEIKVTLSANLIHEAEDPVLVHVPDKESKEDNAREPEIVKQEDEKAEPDKADDEIIFRSDEFSVYAIVYTVEFEYISDHSLIYEDDQIMVTAVAVDTEIPEGSELVVTEITSDMGVYDAYFEALNRGFEDNPYDSENSLLYDVSIMVDGKEYEPENGKIEITLGFKNNQLSEMLGYDIQENAPLRVIHLPIKDIDSDNADAIEGVNASQIEREYVQDTVLETETTEAVSFSLNSLSVITVTEANTNVTITGSMTGTDLKTTRYDLYVYLNPTNGGKVYGGKVEFKDGNATVQVPNVPVGEYKLALVYPNIKFNDNGTVQNQEKLNYPSADNNQVFDTNRTTWVDQDGGFVFGFTAGLPEDQTISSANNTISFTLGTTDVQSSLSIKNLMDRALNYGITAESVDLPNNCYTNFATKNLNIANQNTQTHYGHRSDGIEVVPNIAANVTNNGQPLTTETDQAANYYVTDEDKGKVNSTNKEETIVRNKNELEDRVEIMLSNTLKQAEELKDLSMMTLQPCTSVDLSPYGDDETIILNATAISGENNGFTIIKRPGQTVIFNINGQNVAPPANIKILEVDKNGKTLGYYKAGTDMNNLTADEGKIWSKVVWNFPDATSVTANNPVGGIFLVPNGSFTANDKGGGWIVARRKATVTNEWYGFPGNDEPFKKKIIRKTFVGISKDEVRSDYAIKVWTHTNESTAGTTQDQLITTLVRKDKNDNSLITDPSGQTDETPYLNEGFDTDGNFYIEWETPSLSVGNEHKLTEINVSSTKGAKVVLVEFKAPFSEWSSEARDYVWIQRNLRYGSEEEFAGIFNVSAHNEDYRRSAYVTNYYKVDQKSHDLILDKRVSDPNNLESENQPYAFDITFTTQDNQAFSGTITYQIDEGAEQSIMVSGGNLSLNLKDGQKVVFKQLPYGTKYSIEEKNLPDKCTVAFTGDTTGLPKGTGTIVTDRQVTARNTYYDGPGKGSVSVSKTVNDQTEDGNAAPLTFRFTIKDANGHYVNRLGEESDDPSEYLFTINDKESVRFTGWTVGRYTVEEIRDSAISSKDDVRWTLTIGGDASKSGVFTISENEETDVSLTNTYEDIGKGTLRVVKTVVDETENPAVPSSFEFTLKNSAGKYMKRNSNGTWAESDDERDGTYTITDGSTVAFESLPEDTYTVTEKDASAGEEITWTVAAGGDASANGEVAIEKDKTSTVSLTNTYSESGLRVTKKWLASDGVTDISSAVDRSFVQFHLYYAYDQSNKGLVGSYTISHASDGRWIPVAIELPDDPKGWGQHCGYYLVELDENGIELAESSLIRYDFNGTNIGLNNRLAYGAEGVITIVNGKEEIKNEIEVVKKWEGPFSDLEKTAQIQLKGVKTAGGDIATIKITPPSAWGSGGTNLQTSLYTDGEEIHVGDTVQISYQSWTKMDDGLQPYSSHYNGIENYLYSGGDGKQTWSFKINDKDVVFEVNGAPTGTFYYKIEKLAGSDSASPETTIDNIGEPVTLNASNGWYHKWPASAGGYSSYYVEELNPSSDVTVTYTHKGDAVPENGIQKGTIVVTNKKEVEETGSIKITKNVRYNNEPDGLATGHYYIGVYADENGKQKVGEAHIIIGYQNGVEDSDHKINGAGTGWTVVDNLPYGNYYIFEMDTNGTVKKNGETGTMQDGNVYTISSPTSPVTVGATQAEATVTNSRNESGSIEVEKIAKVTKNSESIIETTGTYHVGLFEVITDDSTDPAAETEEFVSYKSIIAGQKVTFDNLTPGKKYRVYELSEAITDSNKADASDKIIAAGGQYGEYTVSYTANEQVLGRGDQKDKTGTVITNEKYETDYIIEKRWMRYGGEWDIEYGSKSEDIQKVYFRLYRTVDGETYPVGWDGKRIDDSSDKKASVLELNYSDIFKALKSEAATDANGKQTITKGQDLHWTKMFESLPGTYDQYHAVECSSDGMKIYGDPATGAANAAYGFYTTCPELGPDSGERFAATFAIKNDLVRVTNTKTWGNADDFKDKLWIKLQLKRNGENYLDAKVAGEQESWTVIWADLPKADPATGTEYYYSVEETGIFASKSDAEKGQNNLKDLFTIVSFETTFAGDTFTTPITNALKDIEFTFTKIWKDISDQDTTWQGDISIALFSVVGTKNSEVAKFTLSDSGGTTEKYKWTATTSLDAKWTTFKITDLPALDKNGNRISYYVTEEQVSGYKAPEYYFLNTIHQDGEEDKIVPAAKSTDTDKAVNGDVIMNRPENSVELPSTGGSGTTLFTLLGLLLTAAACVGLIIKRRKGIRG